MVLVAASLSNCSFSSCWIRFTGKLSIGGEPSQGGAHALSCHHTCGIGGPYKAKDRLCHPSVVLFVAFCLGLAAHKSGRRARVRASASAVRQVATLPWSPDTRMSGIGTPPNLSGRVYLAYSTNPSQP